MKIFIAAAALAAPAVAASYVSPNLPKSILALVDGEVNPCDNFYQYSCGSWLKQNPLGKDDVSKDYSFSTVTDRNEIVIQDIAKEDWPLIGEFWDSCMDMETRNKLGAAPLQEAFDAIKNSNTLASLLTTAGELSRYGANFIAQFETFSNYFDPEADSINVAEVYPAPTVLTPAILKGALKEYKTYVKAMLELSGFSAGGASQGQNTKPSQGKPATPVKTVDEYVEAIIKLETKLLSIKQDSGAIEATLGGVTDKANKIPFITDYYLKVFDSAVDRNGTVYVSSPNYFKAVEDYFKSLPLDEVKTYVAYQHVNHRSRYLDQKFYDAYFALFGRILGGQDKPSSQESICSYRVKQYFPDLIGKYYFMKMFDSERQENAELLVKLIKDAMSEHIIDAKWLDEETRVKAKDKLGKVLYLIGQSKVKQSYPFSISRDTYYKSIDVILTDTFNKKAKKLNTKVNRDLWSMSPAEVNAYYSAIENKMVFPAAILQAPFFDGKAHPAQNFGSIGAVVGHELTHGFDSKGSQFDGIGKQVNWWTEASFNEFENRTQCLKDQYSAFEVKGLNGTVIGNVDGSLTIGENIADNGGFALTWDAFYEYAKTDAYQAKSGGLTKEETSQVLFLSFAQTWCGLSTDATAIDQITGDVHSPGEFRANGVAMNNPNFASTFKCDLGQPMHPETKCTVW